MKNLQFLQLQLKILNEGCVTSWRHAFWWRMISWTIRRPVGSDPAGTDWTLVVCTPSTTRYYLNNVPTCCSESTLKARHATPDFMSSSIESAYRATTVRPSIHMKETSRTTLRWKGMGFVSKLYVLVNVVGGLSLKHWVPIVPGTLSKRIAPLSNTKGSSTTFISRGHVQLPWLVGSGNSQNYP